MVVGKGSMVVGMGGKGKRNMVGGGGEGVGMGEMGKGVMGVCTIGKGNMWVGVVYGEKKITLDVGMKGKEKVRVVERNMRMEGGDIGIDEGGEDGGKVERDRVDVVRILEKMMQTRKQMIG